jgi:hypothetical protein
MSRVRGLGLGRASRSEFSYFYITACDKYGNTIELGGADVNVVVISPLKVEGTIVDNGEGERSRSHTLRLVTRVTVGAGLGRVL